MNLPARLSFAKKYAIAHLGISLTVALLSAVVVFGLWYPSPYREMLYAGNIYLIILGVDVACGPLLTLILASPEKSRRERWLDFSFIGLIQIVALTYGIHSVWLARPVALAFEVDRLIVVTANEVRTDELPQAPVNMRKLRWAGVMLIATRQPASNDELMRSVDLGLSGISLAMQPDWWQPWDQSQDAMRQRAKPLAELIELRPADAPKLRDAAKSAGYPVENLYYLPLVSSKTLDWTALLDSEMNMVGWAPVDAFE